jgi:tetratricopeptide (TPR) repeat protein
MTTLDLVIALSPPPADAPEEVLAQIALRYDAEGLQQSGALLADPLSDTEREDLRWYLEHYWRWPFDQFKERGKNVEDLLVEVGKRLYQQVFTGDTARDILQAWRYAGAPDEPRRISIVSTLPTALALPWELLHDTQGFLVLRTGQPVNIVRRVPRAEGSNRQLPFTPPLRVLLVTSRPDDTGFIDPRSIAHSLYEQVEPQMEAGELFIEFLRPPTLAQLRKRLSQKPPIHVLHFDGHGTFGDAPIGEASPHALRGGATGKLVFENDDGKKHLVPADEVAQVLQDSGVRLAVLNACQSAQSNTDDALSSVSGRLVASGIDAVVAMSASVLVVAAARYVQALYEQIAAGEQVPIAHERARQALHDDPKRHVLQRRRDEPGEPVTLRDWWLPHFYQQRALDFTRQSDAQPATLPVVTRKVEQFPDPPRYGFGGRARELLTLERDLLKGRLVVVHGFGGQGKTTLATEAADWLTRTGMYRGALFVPLENPSGGASWLLAELGRHLGCDDGSYDPNDHAAALARLRSLLRQTPTLLVIDNVESVLERGDAPLPAEARQALWNALLTLREHGAGVVLTTRDTDFGDVRLQPGVHVRHLRLGGLSEADAYALALRLFEAHGIAAERAPYPELMQLFSQLDYHPLALERVLPALADTPIDRVLHDFSALLGRFLGEAPEERNRSLLASLDYSLRRLTDAQRALLPRLAPFEGGASEDDLLAITEIDAAAWADLRRGLEQAALIVPEQVANYTAPFLRFHPILAPYLRAQSGADDAALLARYTARYAALAAYLYNEDQRTPHAVRALVRRELPNLRRAFDALRAQEAHEQAVAMAEAIAKFLNVFSLGRELADLRRKQEAAAAALAASEDGTLSQAAFLHASGQGEDAFTRGDLRAAYALFSDLLARIEQQPPEAPRGPGSYEHCLTLHRLARCLRAGGQPGQAEQTLRRALEVIDALIAAAPEQQGYSRQRGALLTDLGDVLMLQGRYAEARAAYEESLEVIRAINDTRSEGAILGQLGTLALQQRDYADAARRYTEALDLARSLGEPGLQAIWWHQLGMVAQEQRQWDEAERCYREALILDERRGDDAGAAKTCNQLAIVAVGAGRAAEAEGWYRRALALNEKVHPGSSLQAGNLNNLANLLKDEIRAGRMGRERLAEARGYAERALAIKETLDLSTEPWTTHNILAQLADLEGQAEQAAAYRRRARETFAQFAGNRYHIDQQHGALIRDIAAVARGDEATKAAIEEALPQLEANGWMIADATRRIWAGERDWHALCEGIDRNSALLILRVLEVLAGAAAPEAAEGPDMAAVLEQFAPLLQAIADVARGDDTSRAEIEQALPQLEQRGWMIADATRRIWAGERDAAALTAGLDAIDSALVRRVLEVLGA